MLRLLNIRASTGVEPVTSAISALPLSSCLKWKIYCDDHSSLSSTIAVQIWIISCMLHTVNGVWNFRIWSQWFGNHLAVPSYTAISKNVVGENDERQLSNGDCTTEKKCGYWILIGNNLPWCRLHTVPTFDDESYGLSIFFRIQWQRFYFS